MIQLTIHGRIGDDYVTIRELRDELITNLENFKKEVL